MAEVDSCTAWNRRTNQMTKRRRKKKLAGAAGTGSPGAVRISSYEITDEPILDASIRALPDPERERVQDLIESLRDLLISNPREAIPRVEQAIRDHPTVATLDNFLLAACRNAGLTARAHTLVVEQYKKRPDYLFAKLNYAEFVMDQGRLDEVPAIFDGGRFDLGMLYPGRKVFHVSEATGFLGTVGAYLCRIGQSDSAKSCLDALKQLAPDSPHTKRLDALLNGNALSRLLGLFRSR